MTTQTRVRVAAARSPMLDRLFLGGCTAAYAVLIAAVVAALRLYGS